MIEKTISVDVQWALQGNTLGGAGARVLACSNGTLSTENFTELIGRFSLGTPDRLPQVSVSYATSGAGPDREYYLGMAIRKWAADVQTDDGELLERDDYNRPVPVTMYFCVPYRPLADAAVPYEAMYQKFDSIRLGTTNGPTLPVEFPVRTGFSPIDALAMQSAGRLLTDRPVCVLGAESATVAERIEFIGAVAALLPYGFRTRLTAATWVRSTQREHRFRLFFSDVKRDADPPDDLVYWDRPEPTALTPHDDLAYTYDQWLAGTVGQLGTLARLTKPRSFNREEVRESLDDIPLRQPEPDARVPDEPGPRRLAPRPASRGVKLDVDQILRECVSCIQAEHPADLITNITRLKAQAKSRISPEDRDRYRQFIKEHRLFRRVKGLENSQGKLRDALLMVAFTPPLNYKDYCDIEDSLDAESLDPDPELLWKIVKMRTWGIRINAVVYAQLLPEREITSKLDDWYTSDQMTAVQLINVVDTPWHRERHALHGGVIAADFVSRRFPDLPALRNALHHHRYLARVLQAAGDGYDDKQVHILTTFLKTAYPQGLGQREIQRILLDNADPPSQALLAAVLLQLNRHDEAQLARDAYVFRTTMAMNLSEYTRDALMPFLTFANGVPGGLAAGWDSHSGYRSGPTEAGS